MQLTLALLRKEWLDHRTTLWQGTLILALCAVVLSILRPLFLDRAPIEADHVGTVAMTLGLAVVIWLGGIVSMLLAPDGEKCGPGFLERQPVGLLRIFASKLALAVIALLALWLAALSCTAVTTLCGFGSLQSVLRSLDLLPFLLPALVLGSGVLAFGPLVQRGVLAVAGGPILLVPLILLWSSRNIPYSELARHPWPFVGLTLASLATAAAGFVLGRRLLSPTARPTLFAVACGVPMQALAFLPFVAAADHVTDIDPAAMEIRDGCVDAQGVAQLRVARQGSIVEVRASLDVERGTLTVSHQPIRTDTGPPRHRARLRDRLQAKTRWTAGPDDLCRTASGARLMIEHGVLSITREDGSTTRVTVDYDDAVAVRGDALLLRHQGLRDGERERCRIVDLHLGRAFPTPIVDPDGFVAFAGRWWIADVPLQTRASGRPTSWRSGVAGDSDFEPCAYLHDGDRVLSVARDGRFLVLDDTGTALVDPRDGSRASLCDGRLELPRGDAPSSLADGTLLLARPGEEGSAITSLATGATTLGATFSVGLLIGELRDGALLATSVDRHQLLRLRVTEGSVEALHPTLAGGAR
ncbi:MAG: hypothetical protein U1F36_10365 [Planctomycetota bacterium]